MSHQATLRGIGVSVGASGVSAPAVLLEARDELVPIFVDPGQAQSIEQGRQGIPAERPLTHDLFAETIEDLDATLERVRIDALEDETFYAKLDVTVDRGADAERLVRDARPSDGIALAVRLDCPITIAADVLDEAGRDPADLAQGPAETGSSGPLGAGMQTGQRIPGRDVASGASSEPMDLDDGVEIDIDETDGPEPTGDQGTESTDAVPGDEAAEEVPGDEAAEEVPGDDAADAVPEDPEDDRPPSGDRADDAASDTAEDEP